MPSCAARPTAVVRAPDKAPAGGRAPPLARERSPPRRGPGLTMEVMLFVVLVAALAVVGVGLGLAVRLA